MDEQSHRVISAEDNQWYRLMTIFGSQKGPGVDLQLHQRNRLAWLYWIARVILRQKVLDTSSHDQLHRLEQSGWSAHLIEQLRQLDSEQIQEIETATFKRLPRRQFAEIWQHIENPERSTPNLTIDLSGVHFEHIFVIEGMIFPFAFSCERAEFASVARFMNCVWLEEVSFVGSVFRMMARFDAATFEQNAFFTDARFLVWVYFRDAEFRRFATFANCHFDQYAALERAHFADRADFRNSLCGREFSLSRANCLGETILSGAQFSGDCSFSGTNFAGGLVARETQWSGSVPSFVAAQLHQFATFDRATWPRSCRESCEVADRAMGNYAYLRRQLERLRNSRDSRMAYFLEMKSYEDYLRVLFSQGWFRGGDTGTRLFGMIWLRWLSRYGTDVKRPLVAIVLVAVLFFSLYLLILLPAASAAGQSAPASLQTVVQLAVAGFWPLAHWPPITHSSALFTALVALHGLVSSALGVLALVCLLRLRDRS